MVERPERWNEELYDKLSFDFLIECAKKDKIEEWNQAYRAYLQSEWERIFPGVSYDPRNFGKFHDSDFVRPNFSDKDFKNAMLDDATFFMSDLEGANFKDAHLEGTYFVCAHLNKANFSRAYLQGANFTYAHLEGACFVYAHLEDASFFMAHLEYTNFNAARLEDANFIDAYLKGAKFIQVVVNGGTHFNNSPIDDKTNFTGTSLSSARIFPELRTQLERNIRQIRWEKWYKDNKMLEIPARIFWKISDYGSSTRNIVFTFLFSNFVFMMFYLALRDADLLQGSILSSGNDLLLAYMQTTLVPFGILGIDLTTLSLYPVFIIFVQVIFGYTILAALVTRMAIMFQNLSP